MIMMLLMSTGWAGNPDPKVERLERLERALHIDDCSYAVDELEHLGFAYSDLTYKYALLTEGYLCLGKPQKARLAMSEFSRLGGEPHQLSLRVQEFCALQECPVEPVLVRRVIGQQVSVPEEQSSVQVTSPGQEAEIVPRIEAPVEPASNVSSAVVVDERIQPAVSDPTPVTTSDFDAQQTRVEIESRIVEGNCTAAQNLAKDWVAEQPEVPTAHMVYGDALACYPTGTGDIFAAFDTWMLAKNLAKSQQQDWEPMRERISWALQRSGIVKVIPVLEDGITSLPEDFSISLDAEKTVDMVPRTDHMMGGTYLTNLPTGRVTLTIQRGGLRSPVTHRLNLKPGVMQKIRVQIGKEEGIQLPSIPAPDGYTVTFVDKNEVETVYNPNEAMLIQRDAYNVFVHYKEQQYSFHLDFATFDGSLVDLLPWIYLVRNANGELLTDGMVFPENDAQDISFVLAHTSYDAWKNGTAVGDHAFDLLGTGTVQAVPGSLFAEEVVDETQHPFFSAALELQAAEDDLLLTDRRGNWLTAAMVVSAVSTVTMTVQSAQSDDEIWGQASVAGTAVTLPVVGLWMWHEAFVKNRKERRVLGLIAALEGMDQITIPVTELQPVTE